MKRKFYWARFETRNYTFDAFGETSLEALAALKTAWNKHRKQAPIEIPTFKEFLDGGDVCIHEVELGKGYRDHETV